MKADLAACAPCGSEMLYTSSYMAIKRCYQELIANNGYITLAI